MHCAIREMGCVFGKLIWSVYLQYGDLAGAVINGIKHVDSPYPPQVRSDSIR